MNMQTMLHYAHNDTIYLFMHHERSLYLLLTNNGSKADVIKQIKDCNFIHLMRAGSL